MPAKKKYLSSGGQRALKISAGFLGGYFLATAIHLVLGRVPVIGTALLVSGAFSVFLLWVVFMVFAFLARNGWKVWMVYLSASILLIALAYYGGNS